MTSDDGNCYQKNQMMGTVIMTSDDDDCYNAII